jgi:hypothetical protein
VLWNVPLVFGFPNKIHTSLSDRYCAEFKRLCLLLVMEWGCRAAIARRIPLGSSSEQAQQEN